MREMALMEALVGGIVRVAALVRVLAMVLAVVQDTEGVFKSLSKDQNMWGAMGYIYVFLGSVSQRNKTFRFVPLSPY